MNALFFVFIFCKAGKIRFEAFFFAVGSFDLKEVGFTNEVPGSYFKKLYGNAFVNFP